MMEPTQPPPRLVYFVVRTRDDAELAVVGQRVDSILGVCLTPYIGRRYDHDVLETTVLGVWVRLLPVFSWREDAPRRYQLHATQPVEYEYDIEEFQRIDDYILHVLHQQEPEGWYRPSPREHDFDESKLEGSFDDVLAAELRARRGVRPPSAVVFTLRAQDSSDLSEVGRRVGSILNVGFRPHRGDDFGAAPALEATVLGIWITLRPVEGSQPDGARAYWLQAGPPPDDPTSFAGTVDISDYIQGVLDSQDPDRWHFPAPREDEV